VTVRPFSGAGAVRTVDGVMCSKRGPLRVLVVEDSDDIRSWLRLTMINDSRFEFVGEATNGADAVLVASEAQPDVVVLDQQMPLMTGLEALPHLRRVAPEARVVLYTSLSRCDLERLGLADLPDDYVPKQATTNQLLSTIIG
jgi:DNA-binding NarL/FixJ family response regulator